MDIKNVKILWDRNTKKIVVVQQGEEETDDQSKLVSSYGACNLEWVKAENDNKRLALLMKYFVHITVNHEISPKDVHLAFSKINQYRDYMRGLFPE
jgi:hypothetical protein